MACRKRDWQIALTALCTLGESPVWDDKRQRMMWVDIVEGNIHEWFVEGSRHVMTHFPIKIGAIALTEAGTIIAASDKGFVFLDLERRRIREISNPEPQLVNNRFNDGKCDPAGRFWAGTMDGVTGKEGAGSLYKMDENCNVTTMVEHVTCSNGLAWSLDHKTLYYIDTGTQQVVAYDFEVGTGQITNRKIVICVPESEGLPDGMTIDHEGMLWIALWGGWKVARWNPDTGEKLDEIMLPVSQVTSCTFGGDDFKDLYITSANIGLGRDELAKQPYAGSLFVIRDCGFKGLPSFAFKG